MKTLLFFLTVLCIIGNTSCKNKKDANKDTPHDVVKTPTDSVMDQVMEGHDEGMAKMSRLNGLQKDVQRVIDSIAKLPAKARVKLEPARLKLQAVMEDLKSAKAGMDKWMEEFNMDSALNDTDRRLRYLQDENGKISAIRKNILSSLAKADSVIKSKF